MWCDAASCHLTWCHVMWWCAATWVMWCLMWYYLMMWFDVMQCAVMWCDAMWCDVMCCHLMWCDVMLTDLMWSDVMIVWCDVVGDDALWTMESPCHSKTLETSTPMRDGKHSISFCGYLPETHFVRGFLKKLKWGHTVRMLEVFQLNFLWKYSMDTRNLSTSVHFVQKGNGLAAS